jgi:hypothetical protein
VLVGHVSTQPQRLGDRLDGEVDEPGSVQDGRQVLAVAQRERSGTARVVGRRQGEVLGGGGGEHGDPLVVGHGLPAHQGDPAAGAQAAGDVGERGGGVAEEHHPEAADRDIEALWCEAMGLRVAVLEADVGQAVVSGSLGGPLHQGPGDVHPQRPAVSGGAGCGAGG